MDEQNNVFGIDWKSRSKNKMFWLALLSSIIVLADAFLKPMGIKIDLVMFEADITNIINAVFGVLIVVGVVMNPQTDGFKDDKKG